MSNVEMGNSSLYQTSLMGEINVSYERLVEVFGTPYKYPDDGYKADVEWDGSIDGLVFTIYNYKDGKNYLGDEGLAVEDITNWHIGGKRHRVVKKILEYIENFPAKE